MSDSTGRVTLKQIAQRAGTSIGTVDRALNNRPGISEESKRHVLEVARELGYRPNRFASALGRKKTLRLGIAYPTRPQGFYRFIDAGVDKAARELQDYGVELETLRYQIQDQDIACRALEALDPARYDGLLLNSAGPAVSRLIDRFVAGGLPVATFNTDAMESARLFFVGNDSRQSGLMGGELLGLFLQGRGEVAVLGNFAKTTPFIERFGGFCEYVQAHYPDIRITPCLECHSQEEVADRVLTGQLAQNPGIVGVFCTGFSSTLGATRALRRLGRREVCLVGYDVNEQTARAMEEGWIKALLYQDPVEQGYRAAMLLARHLLEGWTPEKPRLQVDTHIVIGSNLHSYYQEEPPGGAGSPRTAQ